MTAQYLKKYNITQYSRVHYSTAQDNTVQLSTNIGFRDPKNYENLNSEIYDKRHFLVTKIYMFNISNPCNKLHSSQVILAII